MQNQNCRSTSNQKSAADIGAKKKLRLVLLFWGIFLLKDKDTDM